MRQLEGRWESGRWKRRGKRPILAASWSSGKPASHPWKSGSKSELWPAGAFHQPPKMPPIKRSCSKGLKPKNIAPNSSCTRLPYYFQRLRHLCLGIIRRDASWPVRGWVVLSPHTTGRDPEMKPERVCCLLSSRVKTPHTCPILNNSCGKSWEIKDVWYWFQKYFCFGQNTSLITFLVAVIFHKAV